MEREQGDRALLDHGAGVRAVRADDVEAEVRLASAVIDFEAANTPRLHLLQG